MPKIYNDATHGTHYWLNEANELMFAPMCQGDYTLDTENDGGQVDWQNGVESPEDKERLEWIEALLLAKEVCNDCGAELIELPHFCINEK